MEELKKIKIEKNWNMWKNEIKKEISKRKK